MLEDSTNKVTQLLKLTYDGDPQAANRLWSVVHRELRAIAGAQRAREPEKLTMQATALVHEAYMKLLGGDGVDWQNREHFFALAAKVMRQICVDDEGIEEPTAPTSDTTSAHFSGHIAMTKLSHSKPMYRGCIMAE